MRTVETERIGSAQVRRGMTMNLSVRSFEFRRFTPERFHVLLNSLFKVLFNFPSRYLFAIGLVVIFSLRWSLPPTWSCTLKQPDSKERSRRRSHRPLRAWHPLRAVASFKLDLGSARGVGVVDPPKHHMPRQAAACGVRCWTLPCSLAATGGILVSFFSSA